MKLIPMASPSMESFYMEFPSTNHFLKELPTMDIMLFCDFLSIKIGFFGFATEQNEFHELPTNEVSFQCFVIEEIVLHSLQINSFVLFLPATKPMFNYYMSTTSVSIDFLKHETCSPLGSFL